MTSERKRKIMLPLKISVTLSLDEAVLRGIWPMRRAGESFVSGYVTVALRRYIKRVEDGEIGAGELELAAERSKGKKRNRTLSISGDVVEKMRLYAELDARPLSQYVNLVLKRHLIEIEEQESTHKKRA